MTKRLLDILFSIIILFLSFPFCIPIAIILRFTGEGEIFYTQERIGKRKRPFKIYKFATMLKNSPNIGAGDITVANDPRVLPIGRFLRKAKLNEVPQILNILIGDMSVVGPRPLTPKNFTYYSSEDQKIIGKMRPGLTGIGSIVFRDEEHIIGASGKSFEQCYREDIAPYKAQLEHWYYQKQTLITDLLIIFATAWVVMFSESTFYRKIWRDLPVPPKDLII